MSWEGREAWTFEGIYPPAGATKVGEKEENGEIYRYWEDKDGNVWFQTESMRLFEMEMQEVKKRKRKKPDYRWRDRL